jgi:hypothetical protein
LTPVPTATGTACTCATGTDINGGLDWAAAGITAAAKVMSTWNHNLALTLLRCIEQVTGKIGIALISTYLQQHRWQIWIAGSFAPETAIHRDIRDDLFG